MEAGTVVASIQLQLGALSRLHELESPSPGALCKDQGSDGYYTIYMHMTPIVSVGQYVTQGQEIGTIDSSGCQSKHHVYVARKDPSNNPVNFVIPGCVNLPTPMSWYDDPHGAAFDNDNDVNTN